MLLPHMLQNMLNSNFFGTVFTVYCFLRASSFMSFDILVCEFLITLLAGQFDRAYHSSSKY